MQRASIIGLVLGIGAIVGGNMIEGGRFDSILQLTAAIIVLGGTAGATFLSFSFRDIRKAVASLRSVVFVERANPSDLIAEILRCSSVARRNGLIAIESEVPQPTNLFFRKALRLAIDGMVPKLLVETMEQENITFENEQRRIARVFETAGGFAPTIGILGAVLGLIHVMENLADPSKLGAGIAVAFVATIYGVGIANLILLPISRKLINQLNHELAIRAMIIEGIVGIQSGLNSHYLAAKLQVYLEEKT
jgi:chemotaxis protein MotA